MMIEMTTTTTTTMTTHCVCSRCCAGLYKHLYGEDMPEKHSADGDVVGLERVLSAPGISERYKWWWYMEPEGSRLSGAWRREMETRQTRTATVYW